MRDTNQGDFDFVGVDLDPSGKGQSIVRFFVTPLGGQIDEIMTDSAGENASYDCLWDSTGVLTPDGYVVKMRILYSSLRRRPGDWPFCILRIIPRERRYGISWPRMSKDVQCDICQMARVSGAPVDKPGSPFLIIPFATYSRTQSLEADPAARAESKARLGMDVRYATTALTQATSPDLVLLSGFRTSRATTATAPASAGGATGTTDGSPPPMPPCAGGA